MEDWVRCYLCVEILRFDRVAAELRMFILETEMVGYKVKNSINQINCSVIKTHAHYVHCSIVYNSKDLEPTQMPISDRLDKENVANIYHGILYRLKKMSSCSL